MHKLNYLGIGPKIGIVSIPWLLATIIAGSNKFVSFAYSTRNTNTLLLFGIALLIIGLILYFTTLKLLLKGIKETRLITTGSYSICQNPIYSVYLLILIPSLSLIFNSWLILTSSIVGYILFKIFIISEYKELEKIFGLDYLKYKNETAEFLPCPLKKWIYRLMNISGKK